MAETRDSSNNRSDRVIFFHPQLKEKGWAEKKPENFKASGVVVGQKGPTATLVFAPVGRQKEEAYYSKWLVKIDASGFSILECGSMKRS